MGLKKVILPVLGIDMESAVVERWLKAEGDRVAKGEPIVLVETDKASTEIVSPVEGVLSRIVQPAGATVPVTETMAILEVEGAGDDLGDAPTRKAAVWAGPSAPDHVGAGSSPEAEAVGLKGQSPAGWDGGADIHEAPSEEPPIPLGGGVTPRQLASRGEGRPVPHDPAHVVAPLRASPAARKAARDLGVDLSQVQGTGPAGRIQGEDVRASARSGPSMPPSPTPGLPGRLMPLGKKRRITAERMSLSARTVARLTLNTEIEATEMVRLRARLLPVYEKSAGVRLSYNDLIVKAVATALMENRYLNARWTDQGVYLIEPVNVGVAMAMQDGLVVPVIRNADQKKLAEISAELNRLLAKAREDRLALEDITGGTFTITNLGMFGVDTFTPIVNPPEAAILGVGRIVEKPVGRDGQIVLRPMMGLSLSFDHRIVDGAPAAQFLQRVQQILEEPYLLI